MLKKNTFGQKKIQISWTGSKVPFWKNWKIAKMAPKPRSSFGIGFGAVTFLAYTETFLRFFFLFFFSPWPTLWQTLPNLWHHCIVVPFNVAIITINIWPQKSYKLIKAPTNLYLSTKIDRMIEKNMLMFEKKTSKSKQMH